MVDRNTRSFPLFGCIAAVALSIGCAAPSPSGDALVPQGALYDVIIRGGTVVDGTGGPSIRADVGVRGTRIVRVGDLSRDSAVTSVDATGLIVAPGFINLHSHAAPASLSTAANMLRQGVTTELINPDGGGPLDLATQLTTAESSGLAVNIGAYAPFNSAWASVVGASDRRPTPEQLSRITALLERGLAAGAWGVSAGLDYKPAYYAKTGEVVAALAPLESWRTNFTNHDRLTPEAEFSSVAAMRETIEIGERAGLVPVITHMKLQGKEQGKVDAALSMMRAATARGVYTAADVYPYLAGQTSLAALFVPGWAQEGGRDSLVKRLRDPAARPRIVKETDDGLAARVGGPANVYVIGRNKTLAVLMTELGATSAGDAIARILEVDSPGMIATFGAEPDLVKIMQYPDASIACDCGAARNAAHPRFFGTFPRVLGRYVRDTRALTMPDAVRKMSALPAATIGMADRGVLAAGMVADIAVFDPARVMDHATYEKPMEPSEGVRFVLVNGGVALRDGEPTGLTAGRALRRTRSMPSRPTAFKTASSLELEAADSGHTLTVDLSRRTVRVARGGETLQSVDLGVVQTAPRWTSVSGTFRDGSGAELAFVMIVDETLGSATVDIDGRAPLVFRLAK